jgi:ketosteroid isomerase-like protein
MVQALSAATRGGDSSSIFRSHEITIERQPRRKVAIFSRLLLFDDVKHSPVAPSNLSALEPLSQMDRERRALLSHAAYLPSAKLMPPTHEVASGSAAIEKFFAGLHANGVTNHKLEMIDAGGDDKVVYGTAKWSAKGKDKDGKPADFSGIATHVFERQPDNSLKLRMHTFN